MSAPANANLNPAAKNARVWQRMLSGRRLDLIHPAPLDIEIEDIAHGLARVARWNGQTSGDQIFSVAQHSLLVEAYVRVMDQDLPKTALLAALLHDGPEYVIGDMISPFKAVIGGEYRIIEAGLLSAIHIRFGLANPSGTALLKRIKTADRASAFVEATRLAGFSLGEAAKLFGGYPPPLSDLESWLAPMSSGQAQHRFLQRFRELDGAE
ncbi:MAG: HD family hydrolase [Hyphomicrobiales bacterium]|nr:HD family hydrolase [Hyphomicrobiales bacterium]MDE2115994.1 HD family hydrolase [Hyphomicrobiales bacterium]